MAGEMVLVGCKHPHGVVLNLDRYERTGGQNNAVRRVMGKTTVTLKGWAWEVGKAPDPTITTGGYRLTQVDAEFWDEWYKLNAETSSLIHDRVILPPPPRAKAVDASAQARDHDTVPKMFAPVKPSDVKGIEAAPRPS